MNESSQNTMLAAAIDVFGGQITPHTLPVPQAAPDEILIRIESAGIGAWDPFEREGGFAKMMGRQPRFPYVLGSEGAGTVADVGQKVNTFKKGDRVYAMAARPIPREDSTPSMPRWKRAMRRGFPRLLPSSKPESCQSTPSRR